MGHSQGWSIENRHSSGVFLGASEAVYINWPSFRLLFHTPLECFRSESWLGLAFRVRELGPEPYLPLIPIKKILKELQEKQMSEETKPPKETALTLCLVPTTQPGEIGTGRAE